MLTKTLFRYILRPFGRLRHLVKIADAIDLIIVLLLLDMSISDGTCVGAFGTGGGGGRGREALIEGAFGT